MKRLLALLALTLLFIGCNAHHEECWYDNYWDEWVCVTHPHHQPTTTVVYTSANNGGGYNNNIIVVEEVVEPSYCSPEEPFYHDPEYCSFDYETCCTWQASVYGIEETYCWNEWCGWELVEVYEYY
tara:strand:+ start:54 stop:431 length:378 start_codon:yes stop_codon:yes gene_type:complete